MPYLGPRRIQLDQDQKDPQVRPTHELIEQLLVERCIDLNRAIICSFELEKRIGTLDSEPKRTD